MSSSTFKLVEDLQQAVGNRARALILLKCPDAIMVDYGHQLALECKRHTFQAGWEFCQVRMSLMHAVRDEHGLLPGPAAAELEQWRMAFSHYAAGGTELDAFFRP